MGQETDTTPFTLPQNLFSFFANAPVGSALSQPAMEARRRMALQMMANSGKKGYPKNLGEGLTAIGDALGERGMMNQLAEQEAAYQKQAAAAAAGSVPSEARTAASAKTAYASPNDSEDNAPVPQAGPVATAAPMDTAAPLTPDEAQSGVSGGGYNLLDAQAGMKRQGTGRAQDVATSIYPNNPDMQAYTSQMAAGEQSRPGEVSSTGARGMFQFVPGTARQYGLANPDNDQASGQAFKKFTADNAAIFQRINGRPPTMAELAVMHQQGGQTGAGMIAGTGNASPRNLALNNVPAGADPAQAVGAIKNYYGMPDRPVNVRDAVAQAMTMRPTAQAVPQPNPTSTGGPTMPPTSPTGISPSPSTPAPAGGPAQGPPPDQRMAFAGLPPEISTGVSAAPPAPPAIQAAPQTAPQVAQATPQRLIPQAQAPLPQDEPMSEDLKKGYRLRAYGQGLGDESIAKQGQDLIDYGERQRKQSYDARLKAWQDTEAQKNARQLAEEAFTRTQGTPQAQAEADIYRRTGQSSEKFYPAMDKERDQATQAVKAQDAQQLARNAIRSGVIVGYGANLRVAGDKFANWALKNGMGNDMAANTETMSAALKSGLSEAIETINGVGGRVSDSDVKIAQGIQGTDINLQMKTIKDIMDRSAAINNQKINRYETMVDKYLGGHPQELTYSTTPRPVATPDKMKLLLDSQADPNKAEAMKRYFDEIHGPGAADLEIARTQRMARKRARGG